MFVGTSTGDVLAVTANPKRGASPAAEIDLGPDVKPAGGFLGLAFSPDGKSLYASFINVSGDLEVVSAQISGSSATDVRTLLAVPRPPDSGTGGSLAVDPAGLLYIGVGSANDRPASAEAQSAGSLAGSILRIDPTSPSSTLPYGIPPGNPYAANGSDRPEIWAKGVHDPHGLALDPATNRMWLIDRGASSEDEIDVLPDLGRAANLGWDHVEGDHPNRAYPEPGEVLPEAIFPTLPGCSLVGGFVYRGDKFKDLRGSYLYGSSCEPAIRFATATPRRYAEHVVSLPAKDPLVATGGRPGGEALIASALGTLYALNPDPFMAAPAIGLAPLSPNLGPSADDPCVAQKLLDGVEDYDKLPPSQVRPLALDLMAVLERNARSGPEELRGAFATVAARLAQYVEILAANGYDAGAPAVERNLADGLETARQPGGRVLGGDPVERRSLRLQGLTRLATPPTSARPTTGAALG